MVSAMVENETLRTVISGTAGGIASILAVHPLDTVRTRLQAAPAGAYRGAWHCARVTVRREGPLALYKGLAWPLAAQGLYKAIMFGVYGAASRALRGRDPARPLAAHEGESATSVPTDGEIRLVERGHARGFTFDHVFGAGAAQAEVFSEVEPVIESVLRGFNVCILAYGQTGSGKTFTMEGKPNDEALAGINSRALCRLFEAIDERRQLERAGGAAAKADGSWSFDVAVSYLEIYNEKPNDLLAKEGAKKEELKIFASGETGVVVKNLTLVKASSAAEVLETLQRGAARRSTSATAMNAASSRSHSLVQVHVHGRNSRTGATTTGKLNLVDLAGSERVKKSQVEGQGMKEAQGINKSLSTLGLVLNQLQVFGAAAATTSTSTSTISSSPPSPIHPLRCRRRRSRSTSGTRSSPRCSRTRSAARRRPS